MFGVAAFGGRIWRRATCCLSTSARDYLREVALADLGCAAAGAFMAAQVRFDRIIGAGPAEYRKVLNAWVTLTAAVAIFSYASNLEPSRVYRPRRRRTAGRRTHSVGAGVVRPGECDEAAGVPVYGGIKAPEPCRVLASRSL
jgi:hypothetical protein